MEDGEQSQRECEHDYFCFFGLLGEFDLMKSKMKLELFVETLRISIDDPVLD